MIDISRLHNAGIKEMKEAPNAWFRDVAYDRNV
jgi:hypothetical protein